MPSSQVRQVPGMLLTWFLDSDLNLLLNSCIVNLMLYESAITTRRLLVSKLIYIDLLIVYRRAFYFDWDLRLAYDMSSLLLQLLSGMWFYCCSSRAVITVFDLNLFIILVTWFLTLGTTVKIWYIFWTTAVSIYLRSVRLYAAISNYVLDLCYFALNN